MTSAYFLKAATVTVLTGSLGACSFPFFKSPQPLPVATETPVVQPAAPVDQQETAAIAAPAPQVVVTPVAETGPSAAEVAEQERLERRERREERNEERREERRERSSSSDDSEDIDRDDPWG